MNTGRAEQGAAPGHLRPARSLRSFLAPASALPAGNLGR
jgi:hypothetical protein